MILKNTSRLREPGRSYGNVREEEFEGEVVEVEGLTETHALPGASQPRLPDDVLIDEV